MTTLSDFDARSIARLDLGWKLSANPAIVRVPRGVERVYLPPAFNPEDVHFTTDSDMLPIKPTAEPHEVILRSIGKGRRMGWCPELDALVVAE
jgi:hypothetical protein